MDRLVAAGLRSPNTAQLYRLNLNDPLLPALGELRLREITVPRLDESIQTLQLRQGAATAKIARTVVSGLLGLAVRHGAIPSNPVRDIGRIAGRAAAAAQSTHPDERQEWIARLNADPDAVRKDLPDLCEWMLGTGVRIGEALAVSWDEVDLAAARSRSSTPSFGSRASACSARAPSATPGSAPCDCRPSLCDAAPPQSRRRVGTARCSRTRRGGWRDPSNTSGICATPAARRVRLGHQPRVPQDGCDRARRARASPPGRSPTSSATPRCR